MKTVVSEKGQITIPKAVRNRLGIRAGQVLDVRDEGGRLVASKLVPADRIQRLYGILNLGQNTDAVIDALRGPGEGTAAAPPRRRRR